MIKQQNNNALTIFEFEFEALLPSDNKIRLAGEDFQLAIISLVVKLTQWDKACPQIIS